MAIVLISNCLIPFGLTENFVALFWFDGKKMLLQPFDPNYQPVQVKQDYDIVNKVVLNIETMI